MSVVSELAARAGCFMEERGYSGGSRAAYRRVWAQFEEYCALAAPLAADRAAAAGFAAAVGAGGGERWQVFYRRAVGCLFDLAETGRFALRAGRSRVEAPEALAGALEAWSGHVAGRGLAPATAAGKTGMARRFLAFLGGRGVGDPAAISVGDVSGYVRSLAGLAASTRAAQLYFLREYLAFAVREHGADAALGSMFPVIVTDRDAVLPSVYGSAEVADALAQAGAASESPLRDRAVMLLAATLGLRSGDVKALRFDQIDWANRRLSMAQGKTGRRLDLPLPDECLFALVDYWKNERPDSAEPRVFLRRRAPVQPPAAGNHFHQVVSGCFERAGVDTAGKHRGLHSLRHSAAVGMLDVGAPYPVIGAVLGHANANTTRRYLRVDVERLRPLALEVPDAS